MIKFPAMVSVSRQICLAALLCCWAMAGVANAAGDTLQQLETSLQQARRGMLDLEEKVRAATGGGAQAGLESVAVYLTVDQDLSFRLEQAVVKLDGETVSETTFRSPQRKALRQGGAARVYSGTLLQGRHRLELIVAGAASDGGRAEYRRRWRLGQSPGRHSMVQLHLGNATFSQAPAIDMRVVD